MNRFVSSARAWRACPIVLLSLALSALPARAQSGTALDALTNKDANQGLRAALDQGIDTAVNSLGATDGFLGNPKVRIPLPPALDKIDRTLRKIGMNGEADKLKAAMNHAAEAAVSEARPVLKQALKNMTVADAKSILTGGDDSATQYFKGATSETLKGKFKPIVAAATARLKVASLYDQYAGRAAQFGLIKPEDAKLDDYVTQKALDGLFFQIATEEKAIRKDPLGQASSLVKKVFGALQ